MSKAQQIGYKRVSTVDQSNARQLDGLTLDRMFEDKASGKDTKRPQLEAALSFVRDGDTLVVHSMDRLARNLDDLRKIVLTLTKRGVKVQFVKESLIFTGEDSPMANLLLSMLGAVAQFERELIRERQREGIAIAKKEGVYKGRQPSLSPERAEQLRARIAAGKANKAELAKQFGISRAIRIATGTIVDATIIAAPSSTRNASGERDPEMHSAKKGNQWHLGLKAHIGVDAREGHVHSVATSAAHVSDVHMLPELLHGEERKVWGDGGYQGQTEARPRPDRGHPRGHPRGRSACSGHDLQANQVQGSSGRVTKEEK